MLLVKGQLLFTCLYHALRAASSLIDKRF